MIDTKALALAEKDYIVNERRYFHSHPELGNHEVNTTKHIMAELKKMGVDEILSWDDITGCVGIIGVPGKITISVVLLISIPGISRFIGSSISPVADEQ